MSVLSELAACIRNLVSTGDQARRDGGSVQVETRHGRVVVDVEQFPYGFAARSPSGTAIVLFEGGDVRRPVVLPLISSEGAPNLEDGDAALWTAAGGWIVVRNEGTVELFGTEFGGLPKIETLKTELQKNSNILQAVLSVVGTPVTEPGNGSPSAFQAALSTALGSMSPGDWSEIENNKVVHGAGGA